MLLAWHEYGGGKELLTEIQKAMGVNVTSLMYGPMPTQPFGWFKKPITKADDVKGAKFRTVGLAIDMYSAMGAAVNALPGGEIVPALDRGLLDGAEFNNASSDLALGFQDVSKICMLQSFHQSAEQFGDPVQQEQVRRPAQAPQAHPGVRRAGGQRRHVVEGRGPLPKDYIKLQKDHNVKFYKTPDAILQQQLKIWDEMIAKRSAENPLFKKVLDSQRQFAERAGRWSNDTNVNFRMAFNHYFARKQPA